MTVARLPIATTAPTNNPPSIALDLSNDRVNRGDTFSVRLKANDDSGVDGIWWWATSTNDGSLRDTHTFDCHGANPCIQSWDVSTDDTGTITIHAMSRDTAGADSSEVTEDVRVRS